MTDEQIIEKLKKIGEGELPPFQIDRDRNGNLIKITYEKVWKTGTTEPIEDEDGEVTGYKENFEDHKLDSDQCTKIDEFIKSALK